MLVVIAQKEEMKLVEELGYSNYPVLITGVGGINVIKALKDLPKDTEILNIGYAGSNYYDVGTKLEILEVFTNHSVAQFEEQSTILSANKGYETTDCYTSTDFVTSTKISRPCVFDMELAFIASMFNHVTAIKVVSDKLNYMEYSNNSK